MMVAEVQHRAQLPEVSPGKKYSRVRNRGPWQAKSKAKSHSRFVTAKRSEDKVLLTQNESISSPRPEDEVRHEKWAEPIKSNRLFEEENESKDAEYIAEIERLAAQNMTEEKLWRITGTRNLLSLTEISLVVHSDTEFFANLGELLPRLVSLNLNTSQLKSIRDLGTSLRTLRSLSLAQCGLKEIDGLTAFPELRELELSNNLISELDPLFHHETLQVLHLEKNRIHSLMALEVLGTCNKLYRLELQDNPISAALTSSNISKDDDNYRQAVLHYVPTLRVLDGSHLASADRVVYDEHQLSILADIVANWRGSTSHIKDQAEDYSHTLETSPWQEVLGSKRSRRHHCTNMNQSTSPSVVDHQILLDQDPTASALTLDYEPLSGSALSVIRRRSKPLTEPDSVLSTLDQARELDVQLRRSSESGTDGLSPSRLAEWQAETSRDYFDATSGVEREKTLEEHHKTKKITRNTSSSAHSHTRKTSTFFERPHSAPNEAIPLSPASVEERGFGRGQQPSARPQTSSLVHRVLSGTRKDDQDETSHHLPLPGPVMLPEETSQSAALPRPVSRRNLPSRAERRRRKQQQQHHQHQQQQERAAYGGEVVLSSQRKVLNDYDEEESEDDTAVVMRSAIKARSAQQRCPLTTIEKSLEQRPINRPKNRETQGVVSDEEERDAITTVAASTRLGFDLEGSLAALSQWSEAAADRDDGAVRFQASLVLGESKPLDSKKVATPRKNAPSISAVCGAAVSIDDETLISMLRQPPKAVRHLRTRDGFRKFFAAIPERRMRHLLTAAFFLDEDEPDDDAKRRFDKRMALLSDVMT